MGKTVTKKSGKGGVAIVSILLILVIVANAVALNFYNVITQFFAPANSDKGVLGTVQAEAVDIVEQIADEGIVMVENRNGALPLDLANEKEKNINLFGWSSVDPVISGGIGSGSGNSSHSIGLIEAMENNGFQVNKELADFYSGLGLSRGSVNSFGDFATDYSKIEAPLEEYDEKLFTNAREFSDVAVVTFARLGCEEDDLPLDMSELGGRADEHYLELGAQELALLKKIKSMDFEKVIVLINAAYPMEMGFVDDLDIDAALVIGAPGQSGMNSVARVLKGETNPSGHLVDTWAYDFTGSPAFRNWGGVPYDGLGFTMLDYNYQEIHVPYHSVDYAEGIYVGYRYYETRYVDNETGEMDETAYRKEVKYPFGYGLSYTAFEQEITEFNADTDRVEMKVAVTNTGDTAGKDVVQVYNTAPYTPGGIEKSHVALVDFAKTGLLQPGDSQIIEISFPTDELAAFDYRDMGCYVLEKGAYEIKIMANAHDRIDSRTFDVADTIVYDEDNKRSSDEEPAVARFKYAQGDSQFLSRADWEGTWPDEAPKGKAPTDEITASITSQSPLPQLVDLNAKEIVIKDNGLELADMIGLDYGDPKWDLLLEQMSVKEMQNLIGMGGYATQKVDSIKKPYTVDLDGPTGILSLFSEKTYDSVLYPTAVVIAATWNPELAYEMGEVFSREAQAFGISGVYGPSMNLHRVPFGGRNYEYYSEDGVLSGKIGAGIVKAFTDNKSYVYIKHFALYDQSKNPNGLAVWSNEQAMRELYFKPFEISVKEGNATAVMSAYSDIGTIWCGGSPALLTELLRGEWGFRGMVITDWFSEATMNADQGIYAGNDLMLTTIGGGEPQDMSNAGKQAMRGACHNILYTVANSVAMDINYFGPVPYWMYIMFAVDLLIAIGAALYYYRWIKRNREDKKAGKNEA